MLDAELPNLVQMDVSVLAGVLAERLLAQVPYLDKVFFANSGAEAVEAAIKFARAATGRPGIVYCEHAFHGLSYGALSLNGDDIFREGFGRSCRTAPRSRSTTLPRLERALATPEVAAFIVEPIQGKGVNLPADDYLARRRDCAASTAPCSSPTRSRPASAAPAGSSPSSTGASSPTWCCSPRRCPADMCRSARCSRANGCSTSCSTAWIARSCTARRSAKNDLAMAAGIATLDVHGIRALIENAARQGERLLRPSPTWRGATSC